jgi:hypothetical protein
LYQHLGDTIEVKEIPGTNLGKAQRYTVRAYEVQGLRQTV